MKFKFKIFLVFLLAFAIMLSATGCDNSKISTAEGTKNSNTTSSPGSTTSMPPTTPTTSTPSAPMASSTPSTPPPPYHPPPPHFPPYYEDFNTDKDNTFYKNAPKDNLKILIWRDLRSSEKLLIEQYQKLTGVKVTPIVVPKVDYPKTLATMRLNKNAPDIVMLDSSCFPSIVTSALQPIPKYTFRIGSNCWNEELMDNYKINGLYFGVAEPKSWACEELNYVTYYSPEVVKKYSSGNKTPYELYKEGNWNWETQAEIIRNAKSDGKIGLSVQSPDIFMHSAGQDFVSYTSKQSQYTNLIENITSDSLIVGAWTQAVNLKRDGCLTDLDIEGFEQGNVVLMSAVASGLNNESGWFESNFGKTLEAVPVAGPKGSTAYTPSNPIVWGVAKGAKNLEGAAFFLRYFLDNDFFDFSSTFHNNQFKAIYNILTQKDAKKSVMYGWGAYDYIKPQYEDLNNNILSGDVLDFIKSDVNKTVSMSITRANKDLKRIK